MQGEFPQTVSYNRFVELMEKEPLSIAVMLKMFFPDQHTGRHHCVPLLPKEASAIKFEVETTSQLSLF